MVHIISSELEIPLTAVTVQSSVSGSPIVTFPNVSFPMLSLLDIVTCTRGVGTTKNHNDVRICPEIRSWRTHNYNKEVYMDACTFLVHTYMHGCAKIVTFPNI